jgi:4-hydroxy-tetrahydrodipicolinate synthase
MDYLPSEAKQAARERFTGPWAAITTPFGAAGELDEAALRRDLAGCSSTSPNAHLNLIPT